MTLLPWISEFLSHADRSALRPFYSRSWVRDTCSTASAGRS